MIPYDELVVALQTWRAKKGLPIGQMSGSILPPPAAPPARAAAATPGSGPTAKAPPAPPVRTKAASIPPPSPARAKAASIPPPLAPGNETFLDEPLEGIEALADGIEESHYENDGDDFAMAFPAGHSQHQEPVTALEPAVEELDSESTSVGMPPPRPADQFATDPQGHEARPDATVPRTKKREDW